MKNFMMLKVFFVFRMLTKFWFFLSIIFLTLHRLQQHASNSDKNSPNIVDEDVSSCDDDESEREEQEEENLPVVIVKSMWRD
jgi:hypothetical protein